MIYIRTRYPSAINVAPSSRMHFIFKEQAHSLRSTPRRCFSFLALSSFQVRCAVPTTCVIIFQHNHIMHPMQSPLPYHVTLALFAFGSILHGCFAYVTPL